MRDIARVRELLKQGADVNARDKEHNETTVMLAVKFADAAIVQLLLDAGARADARDDEGRTALFFSSVLSEEFKVLVEAGADIHVRDNEGNTILIRKVSDCASLSEIEALLRLGVDPILENETGESALDRAGSLGLVNVVDRLRGSTAG